MAYRRSLSIRATLFARRLNPSIGCISHHNDRDKYEEESLSGSQSKLDSCLVRQRSFGNYMNGSTWKSNSIGSYGRTVGSPFLPGSGHGIYLGRYMSTSSVEEGSDKSGFVTDVATTLSDSPIEAITSQVPGVSEVAIAAADSALPVAALQYLIDGVHTFTGTNWWISIALTTVLIRVITIPLVINQLKASAKLAIMKPRLEAIKDEMQATGMDPQAVAEGQKRMKVIFNEYGVTPFTPLKGLLIQGPIFISFFFAISNMVEKVPSFKTGGAFWFTDLTTPDSLYIFPVLTGLTFLVTSEFNMQEGLEGNPMSGTMKKFTRVVGVATVPLTMTFAKGIFCYWITSNLYSLAYGFAIRVPGVKKFLGVPDIPVPPPSTTTKSQSSEGFSFLGALKQFSSAAQKSIPPSSSSSTVSSVSPSHEKQYKLLEQKPSPSSAGVSHRIASLERKVKLRKRGGKKK